MQNIIYILWCLTWYKTKKANKVWTGNHLQLLKEKKLITTKIKKKIVVRAKNKACEYFSYNYVGRLGILGIISSVSIELVVTLYITKFYLTELVWLIVSICIVSLFNTKFEFTCVLLDCLWIEQRCEITCHELLHLQVYAPFYWDAGQYHWHYYPVCFQRYYRLQA